MSTDMITLMTLSEVNEHYQVDITKLYNKVLDSRLRPVGFNAIGEHLFALTALREVLGPNEWVDRVLAAG